ncbi:hypothetical protein Gotur_004460 [Gossypium turneri]
MQAMENNLIRMAKKLKSYALKS